MGKYQTNTCALQVFAFLLHKCAAHEERKGSDQSRITDFGKTEKLRFPLLASRQAGCPKSQQSTTRQQRPLLFLYRSRWGTLDFLAGWQSLIILPLDIYLAQWLIYLMSGMTDITLKMKSLKSTQFCIGYLDSI